MKFATILFATLLVTVLAAPKPPKKAARQTCTPNERIATSMLTAQLRTTPRSSAGFLRTAFHDCIPVTSTTAGSGCNGSVRLAEELAFPANVGIDATIAFYTTVQEASCVSMADIIQMGVELAMAATGGPRVSLGRGKRDVDTADENDLPGAGDTYAELKAFYGSKGFNVREMVVSQVGGHSIGSFAGIDFSPNPTSFDNAYATNLLNILENGESLPGHNELPSDLQMITDPEAVIWIKFYADSTRTASGRTQGFVNLNRDFARYLVKQGRLTSSRV